MQVLVTGGSGFIGANVVESLLKGGYAVVSLDRPGSAPPPQGAHAIEMDICDSTALEAALEGVDAVIHCAATTPGPGANFVAIRRAFDVNVGGTINVTEACKTRGLRLLHLSSASVYGTKHETALDEVATFPSPNSPYGISKLAAEQYVAVQRDQGLQAAVLRLGSVFGPHEKIAGSRDTLSPLYQVVQAARARQVIRLPRVGLRDWIYSRDAAEAIIRCLELSELPIDPVNIAGLHEWTVADWCRSLAKHLDLNWVVDSNAPTIDFHGGKDRPPLATARMQSFLGFRPNHDIHNACAEYLKWLNEQDPT